MSDPTNIEHKPSPEGHDAAMVAKFDAAQQTPVVTEQPKGEELILGKFKSQEDLAAAYKALEAKLGAPKEEPKADPKPAEPAKPAALNLPEDDAGAAEGLKSVGLDFNEFSAEFASKGELSTESYEKLTKAGIPKEMVDSYIDGQKAKAEATTTAVKAEIGGEENFSKMVSWAAANLSPEEKAAFNRGVDSPDVATKKLTVAGLYAKYTAANGSDPQLVGGQAAGVGEVFRSTAELTKAMSDPRYKNDPAYRADVQSKLGRSNIL